MKFWDTSALVPLFVREPTSELAEELFRSDPQIAVWALTRVELLSALARLTREAAVNRVRLQRASVEVLRNIVKWSEISQLDAVRGVAETIIEKYPLRAADALQLGAAIVAAQGDPASLDFVTFDKRLGDAARREGFRVIGAPL